VPGLVTSGSFSALAGWRLERRTVPGSASRYRVIAIAVGVLFSFAIGVVLSEGSTADFIRDLWNGSFGSAQGVSTLTTLAFPLILLGLAASIPFRLGLWNIGGEGQLFIGAWAAAGIAFLLAGLNGPLLIALMVVAGMAAGALWMLVPALGRVYLNISEIITTLLLNFVAGFWIIYWAGGPWRDPQSQGGLKSKLIPEESQLPPLEVGSASIPLGFLIAVGFALGLWLIVRQTTTGYEIAILGSSPRTATYAGIPARRLTIAVLLLGGALAGLAGTLQMSGEVHRYGDALSNNSGYTGIIIAVLAGGSELGVIVIALVFAVLTISGTIFRVAGASSDLIFAMYGVTLIFAAIGQGLAHVRLARRPVEQSKGTRGALGETGTTDAGGAHGA
jgi:simple sugar transport system permease protein